MKALNYTIISDSIIEVMKKGGEPLNEEQGAMLHGALAVYQIHIKNHGLLSLIANLRLGLQEQEET